MSDTQNTKLINELTDLCEYGNISLDKVLKNCEEMANEEILKRHPNKIFYSKSQKVYVTYVHDEDNQYKRKAIKRSTEEKLKIALVKFYKDQHQKNSIKNATLKSIYEKWLIYRRDYTGVKNKTIQENVYEWNTFIKDSDLKLMPIREIRPITLIRFFRKITKDRKHTRKRISNVRSVLNGIMTYAIEEEIIEHNPVSDVNFKQFTYKPVTSQQDNVFSKEEVITLLTYLATIRDEPYALAIQFAFYLFIRVGELKAIKWSDINYEEKTVLLCKQALIERELQDDLTFAPRKVTVVEQMKGNTSHGTRKLYLTDEAFIILKRAKPLNPFGKYIFEPNGEIMTTDSFNRRLKKYCREAGIDYHSSHKIRFYNASIAYNGENLVSLSKLMGHSETATTLHYLRNVSKEEDSISAFNNLGLGIRNA